MFNPYAGGCDSSSTEYYTVLIDGGTAVSLEVETKNCFVTYEPIDDVALPGPDCDTKQDPDYDCSEGEDKGERAGDVCLTRESGLSFPLLASHAESGEANKGISFIISPIDHQRLRGLIRDRNAPQRHVWRAESILLSADGVEIVKICARPAEQRPGCGSGSSASPQKASSSLARRDVVVEPSAARPDVAKSVVALTLVDLPGETAHCTADMMAKAAGTSASAVRRIWKTHGFASQQRRQFKLSTEPDSSSSCETSPRPFARLWRARQP